MPQSYTLLAAAALFLAGALTARQLVRLNLLVYRKLGFPRFAAFWETHIRWWTTAVRLVCLLAGLFFLLRAWAVVPGA